MQSINSENGGVNIVIPLLNEIKLAVIGPAILTASLTMLSMLQYLLTV